MSEALSVCPSVGECSVSKSISQSVHMSSSLTAVSQCVSNDNYLLTSANLSDNVDLESSEIDYDFSPAPMDIPPTTFLAPSYFVLPDGSVFVDRKIPENLCDSLTFQENPLFGTNYYVELHNKVLLYDNYNYAGARISLLHNKIKVDKFRQLLTSDFDDLAILQYIEFGFPLGLVDNYLLQPVLKNHSSSYEYFTHIDNFVLTELEKGGLTGPFTNSTFSHIMTSPLMTSVKKPNSRRAVFDASFGDFSLNLNTPQKSYMGEDYEFSFPKLDDFIKMILSLGQGCYMWKRDLSRFFLQLPLDPMDYNKVACIWRGQLLFFTSYVWGCRHAGMNGQRVTNAVTNIHRSLGNSTSCYHIVTGCKHLCPHTVNSEPLQPFNTLNYSDDFAGVELSADRAKFSFDVMSSLLAELGLAESVHKAVSPCQVLTYLGIEFDTVKLEMRVNQSKCAELREELGKWYRRTVAMRPKSSQY